jgi:hypothetical protein
MSKSHVQAVYEQFPWLEKSFPQLRAVLRDARVSRADLDTLTRMATEYGNSDFGPTDFWRIYLLDQLGTHLATVHRKEWTGRILDILKPKRTVEDTLIGLGEVANSVMYIVCIEQHYPTLEVILSPKGRRIRELLEEVRQLRNAELLEARESVAKIVE